MPFANTSAFALARDAALSRASASRAFSSFTVQSIWPLLVAPALIATSRTSAARAGVTLTVHCWWSVYLRNLVVQSRSRYCDSLRIAGLLDSGLLEGTDDGIGGAGSIGIGGLGVFRLRDEADVQDGEVGFDGNAVCCGDREGAIAGVDLELRLGWLLCHCAEW